MRQSDSKACECRNREQDATSHSRSSRSFSSKLMCRKTEQERKPSTQQCMEYCRAGQSGQKYPLDSTGRMPRVSVLPGHWAYWAYRDDVLENRHWI